METLRYTIAFLLGIALPYAVQRWDRGRLTAEQRAGAWNAASWGSALYAFGPLSMLGWCWVTRQDYRRWRARGLGYALARSVALLLAGIAVTAAVALAIVGADAAVGALAGAP